MGASLRQYQEVGDWRGPHDPPGSRFREEQTLELYGYLPSPVQKNGELSASSRQTISAVSLSSPKTVESQSSPYKSSRVVSDTFQAHDPNPRLALIEANRLVKMAREFRHMYEDDDLRPYAEELQKLAVDLVKDLRPDSTLRSILKSFFPGDK